MMVRWPLGLDHVLKCVAEGRGIVIWTGLAYGTPLAAVSFDRTGTTRIGSYLLDPASCGRGSSRR